MSPTHQERNKVIGWGTDGRQEDRPGVPAELYPPRPVGHAHWGVPEHQVSFAAPLVGKNRMLTPVYSTHNPPRGLSGVLRRAAYRVPDYRARRWLLLMMADRVDVLEHNPRPLAKLVGAASMVALGLFAFRSLRAR